ncbi:MAG: hypothetical protein ACREOO_23630, partial [bacterium]
MISLRREGKTLTCLCLTVIVALAAQAQQLYQGPAQGSIPGGARASTDNFGVSAKVGVPKMRLPHQGDKNYRPVSDEHNRVTPAAPLHANEFYDASIGSRASEAPILLKGFQGIPDIGALIPPDPHMAAGPEHLVLTVNSQFSIFDKQGTELRRIDADQWYSNVLANASPGDPQVVYDHHAERFMMIWHETDGRNPFSLYLSISDDSNPLGEWSNWRLPGGQNGASVNNFLNDYPKIGVDENALYVTSRMFQPQAQNFSYRYLQLRIIPKTQLLDNQAGPLTWSDIWDIRDPSNLNTTMGFMVPAVTFGTPATEYLISNSPYATDTFVTLWELIDPLSAAILIGTNIPVTATTGPSNANQLGGGTPLLDVGGDRFRNAVYMNGSLWSAHSVAGGAGGQFVFARYVRLDVTTASLLEDVAFGADRFWYYYPAIQPDKNGNLFITFTRSGLSEYPSARYTGRLKADPPGLQASLVLRGGEANYIKTFGDTRNRWGDYVGIALDPVDSTKVWMLGQYAAAEIGAGENADRWGTWVGSANYTPIPGRHLRFEPDSIRYDTLEAGQISMPIIVTLSNIGSDDLTITAISGSDANFQLSGVPTLPQSLRSFGDLTFSATFTPTMAGVLTTTIRIASDDSDRSESTIALSGRALGQLAFSGTVRDSVTNAPIKARLQFSRAGEATPRALATTQNDGSYAVTILEGEYAVTVLPEIPYPLLRQGNIAHTLPGTTLNFLMKPAPVALVEDDTAGTSRDIYGKDLADLGYTYAYWNPLTEGGTVPANRLPLLAEPRLLLWATSEKRADVLAAGDATVIKGHLDQGYPVILTGENVAENAPSSDSLLAGYFGVRFNSNTTLIPIRGFAGDPIGNGLTTGAAGNSKDQLTLVAHAPGITVNKSFRYGTSNADTVRIAAVRAQHSAAGWRAAFFGFRMENLTQLNRRQILDRTIKWLVDTPPVSVADKPAAGAPRTYRLEQNHPNPFNPSTTIAFEVPGGILVTLKVFDLLGREVATLVNGFKPAGRYRVIFEAGHLPAGEYLY